MSGDEAALRAGASEIAGEIVARALDDGRGAHWLTATLVRKKGAERWRKQTHLYGGGAGIALFLLEAARVLGRDDLRDVALSALRWCVDEVVKDRTFGFYTGRGGVAYALLRAAELTGESSLLEDALRVGRDFESFFDRASSEDLLTGTAGAALAFLHLHQVTNEVWTLRAAERFLWRLVHVARETPRGVTWDVRRENMQGLCGFSHGNAGIVFVLLEASRYLGQPGYRRLALEALRYETSHFDSSRGTWPDFRKTSRITSDEDFDAFFVREPLGYFAEPAFMDAWCHGAAGIGLSRVVAAEYLRDGWIEDAERAIGRTEAVTDPQLFSSFTLCHGVLGNAALFLEAARLLEAPRYHALAEGLATIALRTKARDGFLRSGWGAVADRPDSSLLQGDAGVGYFLLQLLSDETPSILLPRLRPSPAALGAGEMSEGDVARALAEESFPLTMAAMERVDASDADRFFRQWHRREETTAFLGDAARGHAVVAAPLALEEAMLALRDGCASFALVRASTLRARKAAEELGATAALDRVPVRLAFHVELWRANDDEIYLLRVVGGGVVHQPLAPFAAEVLDRLHEPRTAGQITDELCAELGNGADRSYVARTVAQQIVESMRAGIVEIAASP